LYIRGFCRTLFNRVSLRTGNHNRISCFQNAINIIYNNADVFPVAFSILEVVIYGDSFTDYEGRSRPAVCNIDTNNPYFEVTIAARVVLGLKATYGLED
jgi:hypothetical protein